VDALGIRPGGKLAVPLSPAITDLGQLQDRPVIQRLQAWNASAIEAAKFDRNELTVWLDRTLIRDACALLKSDAELNFNFLADVTCVDWHPTEPRFEIVYHLLSITRKERLRLKVRLAGDDPNIESVVDVYPAANFFEREIFDLFGVRFSGHPHLHRILMPDDWQGYPLRKDYPVEGYR
jgi:NADH-quinone oxidoreductase subunit C